VKKFIVTGTDTGLGKTVFAAALTRALNGIYWKPIQAGHSFEFGSGGETDSQIAARLSGAPVLPELYRLRLAASPHKSAAAEGVKIDPRKLLLPKTSQPLIVEGAGGLLVPLTADSKGGATLYIDVFKRWGIPLILCARTSLGTINHTLLSLEAIRARKIPLLGIAFIGDANEDSERIIVKLGKAKRLGRLPRVFPLTAKKLAKAFAANFALKDFQ
jgi:dethiobiotin synthetase